MLLAKKYKKKLNSNTKIVSAWSYVLFAERKEAWNSDTTKNTTPQNENTIVAVLKTLSVFLTDEASDESRSFNSASTSGRQREHTGLTRQQFLFVLNRDKTKQSKAKQTKTSYK